MKSTFIEIIDVKKSDRAELNVICALVIIFLDLYIVTDCGRGNNCLEEEKLFNPFSLDHH